MVESHFDLALLDFFVFSNIFTHIRRFVLYCIQEFERKVLSL